MLFRIRANDLEDPQYKTKHKKYMDFLETFDKHQNTDLWSFFAADFFHDGVIDRVSISHDMRSVSLRVSCPNIKRKAVNNACPYLNPIWFNCHFEAVAGFRMETWKHDDLNNPLSLSERTVVYLEAEINSLEEDIEEKGDLFDKEFCSLIIKTLPADRYIVILFESLRVEPEEPATFEMIRQDRGFEVPLFKPPEGHN